MMICSTKLTFLASGVQSVTFKAWTPVKKASKCCVMVEMPEGAFNLFAVPT